MVSSQSRSISRCGCCCWPSSCRLERGDKGKSRDGSEIKGRFVTVHSIPFFFFEECFIFTCISYPTKLDICACDGGLIHLMFLTVFSGRPVTSLKNGYMTHTHIWPLLFVLTDKKRGISLKKSCVP